MRHELSLAGVWAKVERAKEHRDALQHHTDDTFADEHNRPRLGAKFDAERRENILFVNRMPDLGPFFTRSSILLGDALHSLRSTLDHLVFQLALRHTNGNVANERALTFPITDSADRWQAERSRALAEIHPGEQAIIERYQGYHRLHEEVAVGTYFHPLVMLRDLNNTDKHRLLNTVMVPSSGWQPEGIGTEITLAGIADLVANTLRAETFRAPFEAVPIELGTVITGARGLPPLDREVEMAGYVQPNVALSEGRSAVAVLDKMAAVVTNAIREFEPFP